MTAVTPADQLAELARPFTTTIHLEDRPGPPWRLWHDVHHDALVDQLETVVTLESPEGESVFRSGYGSKPAGRLDALSLLNDLDTQTSQMVFEMRLPSTGSLKHRLALLESNVTEAHSKTINSWWVRARVYARLDGPSFSPNALCPTQGCFERGSIRVRLAEAIATCQACASVWTAATEPSFTRLAEWVAWSSEHLITGHVCEECGPTHDAVREARKKVAA